MFWWSKTPTSESELLIWNKEPCERELENAHKERAEFYGALSGGGEVRRAVPIRRACLQGPYSRDPGGLLGLSLSLDHPSEL